MTETERLRALWDEHFEAGWTEEEEFTREHAEMLMISAAKECLTVTQECNSHGCCCAEEIEQRFGLE